MKIHLLSFFIVTAGALATTQGQADSILDQIENVFVEANEFRGSHFWGDRKPGVFCDKAAQASFLWSTKVARTQVGFTDGVVSVDLELSPTVLQVSGWRQGGTLCIWSGGAGQARLEKISVSFELHPIAEGQNPDLRFRDFEVDGLSFHRMALSVPFVSWEQNTAPGWINQYVEQNINDLGQFLLKDAMQKRFRGALGKKLHELLAKAQQPEFEPLPGVLQEFP